jgi:hypothetical protein
VITAVPDGDRWADWRAATAIQAAAGGAPHPACRRLRRRIGKGAEIEHVLLRRRAGNEGDVVAKQALVGQPHRLAFCGRQQPRNGASHRRANADNGAQV